MLRAAICRPKNSVNAEDLDGFQCAVHPGVPRDQWLPFVLNAAVQIPILHGTAGFGLVEPLNWEASLEVAPVVTATAARYQGLDVLDIHAPRLEALDGIVAVNWLTIIHDELIAKLGGREPLRGQFTKDIICHDVPHGFVIQAGPKPVSGDANGPDELGPYREVARVLRPIFTNGLPYDEEFRGLQALQQLTNPWRYRFFEGAKWPP
jgi:hypothetical protein